MKWGVVVGLFLFVLFAVYVNAQVVAGVRGKQERADMHRAQMHARIETLEWGLAQVCIEMDTRERE